MATISVPVVYRRFKEGDVIALFPSLEWTFGLITSYQHVGQHGGACPLITRSTRPASVNEPDVAALHRELTQIYGGVRLVIRKRVRRAV